MFLPLIKLSKTVKDKRKNIKRKIINKKPLLDSFNKILNFLNSKKHIDNHKRI